MVKDLMENFVSASNESDLMKMLGMLLKKTDIELKTEIRNPPALASLSSLAEACKKIGFVKSAATLNHYIKIVMEYYVSYERKGRLEFVDAFKWASMKLEEERKVSDSFTSNLKESRI